MSEDDALSSLRVRIGHADANLTLVDTVTAQRLKNSTLLLSFHLR